MTDATAPVTTDSAGVNRTSEGQITTDPATQTTSQTTSESQTTTTPTTPAEPKADAKDDGKSLINKDAPKAPEGAPDTYADYKVPDGFTLDAEVKTAADKIFKDLNLTQAQAQTLVDFYAAKTQEAFKQPFDTYQAQRQEWARQAEADSDMRGKIGPGKEVNVSIGKMLDGLGDAKLASEFREILDYTGAGDNPAIVKGLWRISQQLTEGSHVAGRGPASSGQTRPDRPVSTPAQALWPNLPSAANQR